jgi:hypothetical protein
VSTPGQTDTVVPLLPQGGDDYAGTFDAPPNAGTKSVIHSIVVTAANAEASAQMDCGTVEVLGSPPGDTEPPVVTFLAAEPRVLPQKGGQVLIRAEVTDDVAVQQVVAVVALPDLPGTPVPMALKAGDVYEGTASLPPNPGTKPQIYQVVVQASDPSGNTEFADGGLITVAGPAGLGRLEVQPRRLRFGETQVGLHRRRRVTLHNRGSGPLSGSLLSLATPFSRAIRGDPPGDATFTLEPGETLTVLVQFSPTHVRRSRDVLGIVSTDPTKPNVDVALSGEGCRPRRRRR